MLTSIIYIPLLFYVAMWKDFQARQSANAGVSYDLYRKVFDSERITFGEPPQDECERCSEYNNHCKENIPDHSEESCEICVAARLHLERARVSRQEYGKPHQADTSVFAVDMQKVILLPKMTIKEHFFVSRLVVFNETFASLTSDKPDYVILWHEAVSGRLSGDVASAYVKCLVNCGSNKVVFWADNCSAQNKNWTLFTALTCCVNAEWGPSEICIKFLERRHTFMKADSVHGLIGMKMKKTAEILTFDDFVELCNKAGKKIQPITLSEHDFYNFVPMQRARKTKNVTLPLLADICQVCFQKGSRKLLYKCTFNEENYTEVDFLRPRFDANTLPLTHSQLRGIPSAKKDGIVRLMRVVKSSSKLKFWKDLPVNDAVHDLTESME